MLDQQEELNGISVIICCYNSSTRLPKTLWYLAKQEVPHDILWEIIVVDNASTDCTYQIAQAEWHKFKQHNIPFNIVKEHRPGKVNALKAGVKKASFKYIIICDDDNWLNNDYVARGFHTINTNSNIGAVGGQSTASIDGPVPEWFSEYAYAYAVGKQNEISADVTFKNYLWGAGMIFRKSAYWQAYQYQESLLIGPCLSQLTRGEDVEFCMRLVLLGYKLFYDEQLVFKHFMPANRLTEEYRKALLTSSPYEIRILNLYRQQIHINNLSIFERGLLLFLSVLRYVATIMLPKSKWEAKHECEVLHLLSGLQFSALTIESKQIHSVYRQLQNYKPRINEHL
jgi:glycosyltransferase involved in cell wall biosynthesis